MLLPRSELNVNDKSRERLFPWWSMLLFGATVAAMLLLFFPQRWLLSQVGQTRPGDRVSEQYLATLLASQPDNAELRLALVRQYLAGNGWPQARKALAPLLHSADPQQRATAQLLQFDSIAGQMAAEVEDTPARAQLLQQLWQFTASSTQTSARLTLLANEAERQNRYDIASRVYQQLIEANPDDAPRWLEQAAQSALARGQYQDAAARYFQAQQLAHTLPLRRRYLLAGLRTLQSGNLLPQAVAAAREHAGTLADDRETQLFLVKLCRAAGDLNEAERYARKLLQMSLLFELQQMQARSGWQLRHVSDATDGREPQAPFDTEAYRLGYEVFLGNRKLHDAYLVAQRAVAYLPADREWRKRLAQVAEWDQHPAEALPHWLWLARQYNDRDAWEALLRLAPGLHDDAALLLAWQHKAESSHLSEQEWHLLADLYERSAAPLEGAHYLLERYRARPQPQLLQLAGDMQLRGGDDDAALASYRQLARQHGQNAELAMQIATLQFSHNDLPGAYATLQQAPQANAPEAYWRMLAQLAWQLEQRTTATHAYMQLLQQNHYNRYDLERLIDALHDGQPDSAVALALRSFREFGNTRHLLLALDLQVRQQQWQPARQLLDSLDKEQRAALADSASFWSLSAQIRFQTGQRDLALDHSRQAIARDPASAALRQQLLWLLIDSRAFAELQQRLDAWRANAAGDNSYRDVYAAGYLALGKAQQALPWFAAALRDKHQDPLWLTGYADALEQALQPDLAWRVRRHVWNWLQQQPAAGKPDQLLRQARLALLFAPVERNAALLRQLLRQDQTAGDSAQSAQVAELALVWALSTEQDVLARSWLLQRYADAQQRPHWAELSLALQQRDQVELQRLLEQHLHELPANDAIEAAQQTGQLALAQQLATGRIDMLGHDDVSHAQLVETMLQSASQIDIGSTSQRIGGLNRQTRQLQWSAPLAANLHLSLELSDSQQGPRTGTLFPDLSALDPGLSDIGERLPHHDRQVQLTLTRRDAWGQSGIELARRNALGEFTALQLSRELQLDRQLSVNVGIGINQPAEYSERLLAFGVKDGVQLGLRLMPTRLDYAAVQWRRETLRSQSRHALGKAALLNWEIGHRLRTEYPDWTIRLSGYHNRFHPLPTTLAEIAPQLPELALPDDQQRLLLPEDSRSIGVNLGFGQQFASDYSRAARLFGDVGISHSPSTGVGYNWLLGIAGSALGNDHLSLWAGRSWGGTQNALDSGALGIKYKLFY